jgi:anti-sigma regulatory factor (Ser/Thr protein kinase)
LLVTNAFRHGHGTVRLRLNLESDGLTGEVVDEGTGFEREVRAAGADVVGGRGLLIVSALVREWGIHEGSSHVWFEVGRGPTPETTTEPQLGEAARPDEL